MSDAAREGATPPRQPFHLVRYFLLAGIAIVGTVGLLMLWLSSSFATAGTIEQNKTQTIRLAKHLTVQIYDHLLEPRLGTASRSANSLAALRDISELDEFVRRETAGLNLRRVKIFDLNGRILYSDDPGLIGQAAENMSFFERARAGETVAELEQTPGRDGGAGEPPATLMQAYTPIVREAANGDGITTGVFEIYLDIGPELQQQIAYANQQSALATGALLGLLFGGLLLIVMRADREIRSNYSQLVSREEELGNLNRENARLYALTRSRRQDEQDTLLEFSRALLRSSTPDEVRGLAVRAASNLIAADSATLWQPAGVDGRVQLTATDGTAPYPSGGSFEDSRSSLPALIIRRRQVVEMTDTFGDGAFSLGEQLDTMGYRAALGAPLRHGEHTLGALVLFRQEPNAFDEDDSRLLTLVANQTAVAFDQVRLFQALAERERFAGALVRLSLAVNATLKLDSVLEVICREAADAFASTTTIIWQRQGSQLVCVAAHGFGAPDFLGMQQPLDDPALLGARVIREKKPLYVNRATETERPVKQAVLQLAGGKALLGVPFFQGEQTLGAMVLIDRHNPERYGDEDIARASVLGQLAAIAIHNAQLYERTRHQSAALATTLEQLEATYDATLAALSRALDARDRETEGHSLRVTAYALELARRLGWRDEQLESLERGALLHDIGKIGVPDAILRKPDALTVEEWRTVREHPRLGEAMLKDVPFLEDALDVVRSHQERYDGTGYPQGLSAEMIPPGARVFAVADAFDAITSDRPYRKARAYDIARCEIGANRGTQFDPAVVDAFVRVSPERWDELREKVTRMPDVRVRTLVFGDAPGAGNRARANGD